MKLDAIAIVGPLTGPRAAYGRMLIDCALECQLRIPIIWGDDRAEPATAIAVANRLVKSKASIIIGHLNSECANVAARIYGASNYL